MVWSLTLMVLRLYLLSLFLMSLVIQLKILKEFHLINKIKP
ncbi:hypothetical protein Goklo_016556 [Gossypium klotzschianum]|uniref:Uncharacterized protein n=2 Tax=Gossypium klotzschianum TaxID=34286 RepID=A0A7J8UEP0_9ROSI|nr:hypothetical protein [Gossypium klotzschianum]